MKLPVRKVTASFVMLTAGLGSACAQSFGPWSDPQPVSAIDTASSEGCPIESPDGLALYFASGRSGGQGKSDNWRALRASVQSPFATTENLGAVANSPEFDYCPTPLTGGNLLFVSSRQTGDDCYPGNTPPPPPTGGPSAGDIFSTVESAPLSFSAPVNLGCYPNGPNTAGAEFSPSVVTTSQGTFLFFSSNGYPDSQGQDIYMAQRAGNGTYGPGVRVAELSTPDDDRMPNVRGDGLEIVFSSNHGGNMDIYTATRASTSAPWSAPQLIANANINTGGSETRSSLSADGTRLYFGRKVDSADPGDVFVATRVRAADALHATPTLNTWALILLAALVGAGAWLGRHRLRLTSIARR